ncbi:MAG: hypothetical protein P4L98_10475 [Ancalomicrobiaceae bacterium]|nr:hypothetical protein [Ancalomicrobiaceae bacterium]
MEVLPRMVDRTTSLRSALSPIGDKVLFVIALLVLYAGAFLLQWSEPSVTDVSWLFVICEKMLAGEHLYTDIMETNPPMSVFLYMPTVVVAHALRLSPELVQICLTLALMTASVGWTSRMLYAAGEIRHLDRYRLIAAFAFGVLALGCFSEREHIALLTTLPTLAILVLRLKGRTIGPVTAVIAGLGEGLAVTIKPQMALPILLAVGLAMVWSRSLKPAFRLEHWIGVAIVGIYVAVVGLVFPAYFTNMMPVLMDTYRAVRYDIRDIASGDGAIAYYLMVAALIVLKGRRLGEPRLAVPLIASFGYYLSYIDQSKGWAYHLYPAVALATFLLFDEAIGDAYAADVSRLSGRLALTARIAALAGFGLGAQPLSDWLEGRQWDSLPLAAQIRHIAPHPSIAIISDDLGLTNPLIRMVGGSFVGTVASQWITQYATYRIDHHHLDRAGVNRMKAWVDYDRDLLAGDIGRSHPDFIVVDRGGFDWLEWARQSPALAKLIADYRQAGRANDIYLLARADLAPQDPHPATGKFWRLGGSDRWLGPEPDESTVRMVHSAAR